VENHPGGKEVPAEGTSDAEVKKYALRKRLYRRGVAREGLLWKETSKGENFLLGRGAIAKLWRKSLWVKGGSF